MPHCTRQTPVHTVINVVLFICSAAAAQEVAPVGHGPYLKATGSFGVSLGYGLGVGLGGGFDYRFSRALLLSDAVFDTADKVDAKGSTLRAGAGLYYMRNDLGLGGGARCSKLTTAAYGKGSCRPFVGAVFDAKGFRFDAAYLFSGTDRVNHLQGLRTVAVLPFTRHVQFELETGFYRFHASGGPRKYFGFVVNPGIRYRF